MDDVIEQPARARRPARAAPSSDVGGIAADRLRSFVERIERLEEEKRALASDIKDVFAEAKGAGFDIKILRKLISLRRVEAREREEMDELLALYMRAIGMAG
ncbi:MAG: DUF2312 domain-containing protein [Acidisphaera sp.]|nr:DUF2312 domain-containing protein [Acidisphaera sp.]MBV9812869.1 DUF2312 domain-containing protein [Acetobacteraceae bacterium]